MGIAVADLESAISFYELLLGTRPAFVTDVPDQKVKVAMFAPGGGNDQAAGGRIELLAGTDPDSPVSRFIDKRGEGLHHLCVYVDDIDSALVALEKDGVRLIDREPRVGAEGHRIAFVHPASTHGVLIELEERPE